MPRSWSQFLCLSCINVRPLEFAVVTFPSQPAVHSKDRQAPVPFVLSAWGALWTLVFACFGWVEVQHGISSSAARLALGIAAARFS